MHADDSGSLVELDDDPIERAATVAATGLRPRISTADAEVLSSLIADDPEPRVRLAAFGALTRHPAALEPERLRTLWLGATSDPEAAVRRRLAELAPRLAPAPAVADRLVELLDDDDSLVAEAAAFALGELPTAARPHSAVAALSRATTDHQDALVREAAVAALGAVGDPEGLPAVLAALHDRPQVRRRAVQALAPFEGPEVEAALRAALEDRDWQVRQAAEDLLAESDRD